VEGAHRAILDGFSARARREFVQLLERLSAEARDRIGKRGCAATLRGGK
jgi:hypothetical protein